MAITAQQQDLVNRTGTKRRRLSPTPYLFILPHLIFFALFIGYPFFKGFWISLHSYDFLRPERTEFVALGNYLALFTPGTVRFAEFWNAMQNTLEFVLLSVPPLVIIPLGLAVLLNAKIRGRNFFRALYFAPWVLSVAVVGILWWWIFQTHGGLVNLYLWDLGIRPPRWLSTMPWAWIAIVVATVWWTSGFNMIIFLAALQGIPGELYEAAAIDGGNRWQLFWKITMPLLRPVFMFIVVITIIASFNLFGQPFFMTGGGPAQPGGGGATEPVMYRIYIEGFVRLFQGSAAAMSFVVAAFMIAFSYLNLQLFRRIKFN